MSTPYRLNSRGLKELILGIVGCVAGCAASTVAFVATERLSEATFSYLIIGSIAAAGAGIGARLLDKSTTPQRPE